MNYLFVPLLIFLSFSSNLLCMEKDSLMRDWERKVVQWKRRAVILENCKGKKAVHGLNHKCNICKKFTSKKINEELAWLEQNKPCSPINH